MHRVFPRMAACTVNTNTDQPLLLSNVTRLGKVGKGAFVAGEREVVR